MSIDRRDFLRRSTLATAAGLYTSSGLSEGQASSSSSSQGARAGGAAAGEPPSVQFDFTGLFAFTYYQKTKKMMTVILPNAMSAGTAAGLAIPAHAPLMMMPWDAFDHTRVGGKYYHAPPAPVHIGSTLMAMWSLADMNVWIDDFSPGGLEMDPQSDLTFKANPAHQTNLPSEPGAPADLEDLYWFADLRLITKRPPNDAVVPLQKHVSSQIQLTRGTAGGRPSVFACENRRLYRFNYAAGGGSYPPLMPRVFVSQMTARHPVKPGTGFMTLMFSHRGHCDPRPLFLKLTPDRMPCINIMNMPSGHPSVGAAHFPVFYGLIGETTNKPNLVLGRNECPSEPLKVCEDPKRAAVPLAAPKETPMRHAGYGGPASPYDGCIPPGLPQEGP